MLDSRRLAAAEPHLNIVHVWCSEHDASLRRAHIPAACNRKLTLTPSPCHTYFKPTAAISMALSRSGKRFRERKRIVRRTWRASPEIEAAAAVTVNA
ncbi:unnamed protein product [Lasius platythorax]|uniref:Uncharacterized protein n=1 Tax=Lasius platythorax TaxID=488582 RepID=A0AAV2N684_9HYME